MEDTNGNKGGGKAIPDFSYPTGKNYLLLIGIDKYKHFNHLNNCVRDVEAIASVLFNDYQFEDDETCIRLYNENATREAIFNTFATLAQTLTEEDNLVFIFSGHGEYVKNTDEGYWITVESEPRQIASFLSNSVIKDLVKAIRVRHVYGIVDSCFSISLLLAITKNTEKQYSRASRFILTSGDLEPVLDGPPGKHSPLIEALIYELRHNNSDELWGTELSNLVKRRFDSSKEQSPSGEPLRDCGHERGQYVFLKKHVGKIQPKINRGGGPANLGASYPTGNNYLLLIAIDEYKDKRNNKLYNCKSDVDTVKEKLWRYYQFEKEHTFTLYNEEATREAILYKLNSLLNTLTDQDNLIFMFSGHGNYRDNTNRGYWVTYDSKHNDKAWASLLSNREVKGVLEEMRARHILVIIDSCFSGAFLRKSQSINTKKVFERPSRYIITSGNYSEVVSDGIRGKHSPFAASLIYELENNKKDRLWVSDLGTLVLGGFDPSQTQSPLADTLPIKGHKSGQFVFLKKGVTFNETNLKANNLSPSSLHKTKNDESIVYEDEDIKKSNNVELLWLVGLFIFFGCCYVSVKLSNPNPAKVVDEVKEYLKMEIDCSNVPVEVKRNGEIKSWCLITNAGMMNLHIDSFRLNRPQWLKIALPIDTIYPNASDSLWLTFVSNNIPKGNQEFEIILYGNDTTFTIKNSILVTEEMKKLKEVDKSKEFITLKCNIVIPNVRIYYFYKSETLPREFDSDNKGNLKIDIPTAWYNNTDLAVKKIFYKHLIKKDVTSPNKPLILERDGSCIKLHPDFKRKLNDII